MLTTFTMLACVVHGALAATSLTASITSTAGVKPEITISTAVPVPTGDALDTPLPSQVALAPKQAWCPSEIFCAGALLQAVNLAKPYTDPKTIVDKPTSKNSSTVVANFKALGSPSNLTVGQMVTFLKDDFSGEGRELEALVLTEYNQTPAFLAGITDPLVKAFSQTVHGFWTQLIRGTNKDEICSRGECESSLIPLNHTFVVPGGRFREQYYWDSFWIIEGLIQSELYGIVNDTLQNFMDEIDTIGFIPNGGRIYYLNRSQPPLFIHMLWTYVQASNDTEILKRALPLAEKELKWWDENRSINVTSPFTNQTYKMARFAVNNTAPRPESYLQDYETANDPTLPPLDEAARAELYSQIATGAESGWDYSARWFGQQLEGNAGLRTLNVKNIVPVCLNSILYKAHNLVSDLYSQSNSSSSKASISRHASRASVLKAGILDLFWDSNKLGFYDFNTTGDVRSPVYSAATFYPLWNDIIPDELVESQENAFGFFASLNLIMNRYNGTFPVTFLTTGQQWDAPNAWPPHQYIALEALRNLPKNVTTNILPSPAEGQSSWNLVPENQIGINESQLPVQPLHEHGGKNASMSGPGADLSRMNGTVVNGGKRVQDEGWGKTLQRELANRYITSALCSWRATGGSIPELLPRLADELLNLTDSVNNVGNMFEKFSSEDVDSGGRGGEYTVQAGFGWTNGVVLWIAKHYGDVLVAPECPVITVDGMVKDGRGDTGPAGNGTSGGSQTDGGSSGMGLSASVVGLLSAFAVVASLV